MKLFLTVVLASVLMMKTAEGVAKALGETCAAGDTCPVTNAACADVDGTNTCSCNAGYTEPTSAAGTCKKKAGEACEAVGDCAVNACTNKKCGKANDATCTMNTDCATLNCKYMKDDGSEKCADAGAAGVMASVLLMVATLMTSRIL